MKSKLTPRILAMTAGVIITLGFTPAPTSAQGTAFTYQGRLNDGASVANGTYDVRCALYDALTLGTQQGPILTNAATAVSNGLFTVALDFGNQFPGANRWLEIAVRTNGSGAFSTLAPRQSLTPTPYAIRAANFSGPVATSQLTGTIASNNFGASSLTTSMLAGGAVTAGKIDPAIGLWTRSGSNIFYLAGGVGINNSLPNGAALAVGGAVNVEGTVSANAMSAASVTTPEVITPKIGTAGDVPLVFYVNGARALRLEQSANSINVIGGWTYNDVAAGVIGATVWGGGYWFTAGSNSVAANFGTVSGGRENTVVGEHGTVSGGRQNSASNAETTVAGGRANTASGGNATVGGGYANTASGSHATVAGGRENSASGEGSMAMGIFSYASGSTATALGYGVTATGGRSLALGFVSHADGEYATAIGAGSYASHRGSFVWSDASGVSGDTNAIFVNSFGSTSSNQFLVRAAGGVGINLNNPQSTLHVNGTARINGANNWGVSGGEGDFRVGNDSYRFKIGVANAGGGAGDIWMRAHGGIERINVKAPGGTRILSNEAETSGVSLAPSGTAWAVISDRNVKKDFASVDSVAILEKLAAMPITQWHYTWEEANVTPHIGPMAQDFKAAFYPGTDDKSITTQEADGVALAAIQGLNQKLEAQRAANAELRQELAELKQLVQSLVPKQ